MRQLNAGAFYFEKLFTLNRGWLRMAKLVVIDPGHGLNPTPTPGKRTPNIPGVGVIYEHEFNMGTAKKLADALKRCGFNTIITNPDSRDISLAERCRIANDNKADLFVSVHYNHSGQEHPGNPGAAGVETYYYSGISSNSESAKIARAVQSELIKGTPQKDRGVKTANFYVLRNTAMPAILVEAGFMDDEFQGYKEAKAMRDPVWQQEVAEDIARGICQYFGVVYKPPIVAPPTIVPVMYVVQVGAYTERANAEAKVAELKKAGFEAFIKEVN